MGEAQVKHLVLFAAVLVAPQFALHPPARCADALDRAHCEASAPKAWTAQEQRAVNDTLERLAAHELARGVLAAAHAGGYTGLQRYRTDTQRNAAGVYVTKFGPAFVLFGPKIIGVTDAFFELAELQDPIGNYRIGDLVLLHELAHAYDDRALSTQPEFTALTGWQSIKGRWEYTNRVSISEYNGVYAETVTLYARGRSLEAWTRDRSFATKMRVPLPRIQALATPGESFADILAHLILDPEAATYLPEGVVKWFEQRVYPALRDHARKAYAVS